MGLSLSAAAPCKVMDGVIRPLAVTLVGALGALGPSKAAKPIHGAGRRRGVIAAQLARAAAHVRAQASRAIGGQSFLEESHGQFSSFDS